jgi:hypothetical protein
MARNTALPGARIDLPDGHGGSRRYALRASFMVRVATLVFIGVAVTAVFRCATPHEGIFSAGLFAALTLAALGAAAGAWERRQPAAFALHSDGVTLWDRSGRGRYYRVTGCAQWSERLLALTLRCPRGRATPFIMAADAVDPEAFRELAVRARRSAQGFL